MMHLIEKFEHLKTPLETIISATNNFDPKKCIGGGGFGKVYKGELLLSDHTHKLVAFKRLDPKFGQGNPEFWKEIITLSLYKHENIVSLLGFCDEGGEKILIYEYASKGSLDAYLNNDDLKWVPRLKICIGAARGLAYLHDPGATHQRVLHRDIKSSNILLDDNWNARIADLGLSKFGPANQQYTFLVSNAVGTIGYCDPLYVETGLLTKESDVYSFGVVLFEVLCGRLSIGNSVDKRRPLTGLVRRCYEEHNINEVLHANLKGEINPPSLQEFSSLAYQCISRDLKERPVMIEVVSKLETALRYQIGGKSGYSVGRALPSQDEALVDFNHDLRMGKLKAVLDQETWIEVDVPNELQAIVDSFFGLITDRKSSANLIFYIGVGYHMVNCGLILLKMLSEYIDMINVLPALSSEVIHRVLEMLKFFNKRTYELVLGAGAMQVSGLKSITSKHLALASQVVSFVHAIIPEIRKIFQKVVPEMEKGLLFSEIELVSQSYNMHRDDIHTKLIQILRERLIFHLHGLPQITETWNRVDETDIQPSQFARSLTKEVGYLQRVLSRILHEVDVQEIFKEINIILDKQISDAFARLSINTPQAKARLNLDIQHILGCINSLPSAKLYNEHGQPVVGELDSLVRRISAAPDQ